MKNESIHFNHMEGLTAYLFGDTEAEIHKRWLCFYVPKKWTMRISLKYDEDFNHTGITVFTVYDHDRGAELYAIIRKWIMGGSFLHRWRSQDIKIGYYDHLMQCPYHDEFNFTARTLSICIHVCANCKRALVDEGAILAHKCWLATHMGLLHELAGILQKKIMGVCRTHDAM